MTLTILDSEINYVSRDKMTRRDLLDFFILVKIASLWEGRVQITIKNVFQFKRNIVEFTLVRISAVSIHISSS